MDLMGGEEFDRAIRRARRRERIAACLEVALWLSVMAAAGVLIWAALVIGEAAILDLTGG